MNRILSASLIVWTTAAGVLIAVSAHSAIAEVSSRNCPYDCNTENIPRSHCKDWRQDGKCFIDDLRPARPQSTEENDANLRREISNVNKTIRAGKRYTVELENKTINRIDVVARRDKGASNTQLTASLERKISIGSPQQVSENSNAVVRFAADGINPNGKELTLSAMNGDVFVESVHVLYEKN